MNTTHAATADPFLDPAGHDDPNPLDTVAPAWGLPLGHADHPARRH